MRSSRLRINKLQQASASPEVTQRCLNVAVLIIRLALAWIFIYYGSGKLFGWFHGTGIHGSALFFANTAHLHPGTFFAVLSGVTEFVGGIAIGLGLLGRVVGLALAGDMVIAMITVTFKNGLTGNALGSGYGLNVALAALALGVVLLGTGRYSLDHSLGALLRGRHSRHNVAANTRS